MRILFLTPQLPYPLHQGTAIRNYGLIRGLSERHQVSLLSFSASSQPGEGPVPPPEVAGPLLELCQRVETVPLPPPRSSTRRALDTLTHRLPDMALRLACPAFSEQLATWLARESFDVVHVEGIEMTPYLDLLMADRPGIRSPLVIFDDHNCEYALQKSYAQVDARIPRRWPGALYSFVQWQKLRRYEAHVCRRAHHILAVSRTDAEMLQRLGPGLRATVIPNGIDTDLYEPGLKYGDLDPETSQTPTLVFTGKMDYRPNVDAVRWFVEAIWPRVRAEVPEAHFFAVGQRPHPQLEHLSADPSVTLTGWVKEVRPYITEATVYIAPLRMGSGTRLKLLEAMAMGKAIVSTRLGAEGLADAEIARPQKDSPTKGNVIKVRETALVDDHEKTLVDDREKALVDDGELALVNDNDPAAFADAVIALLRDPTRRARLGAAGKAFVKRHFDWRVIIPRLEALYAERKPVPRRET